MKHLAYVSTAIKLMDGKDLLEILKTSQQNNMQYDVTGVLLYAEGTFIQALEGEAEYVDKIYAAIERDHRHKNIIKLTDGKIEERYFPDWTMGFANIDLNKARKITGFLGSTSDLANDKSKNILAIILRTFIDTNNLTIKP